MLVLAKYEENSADRYKNNTTMVFQWDKTIPVLYKIGGTWSTELSNIPSLNLHLITFSLANPFSDSMLLFIT